MFGVAAANAAPILATKAYVDSGLAAAKTYTDNAYLEVVKNDNTLVPSWATLNAASYGPAWGSAWFVETADRSLLVDGIAACLGNNSNDDTMSQASVVSGKPNLAGWGKNCFCKVQRVNNQRVTAAWVFLISNSTDTTCNAYCHIGCALCARNGSVHSCARAKLFAAP
ncbi:MAG: hypothetical protein LBL46_01835 [Rickettsiales bacterium]|jgi:aspartyl aminopeptidase|nr:hypothetical protein [Rickettsiales bacterium]